MVVGRGRTDLGNHVTWSRACHGRVTRAARCPPPPVTDGALVNGAKPRRFVFGTLRVSHGGHGGVKRRIGLRHGDHGDHDSHGGHGGRETV